ncbi:Putative Phospholipase D [Rhizopus microsporus]|nr:Putative Phospholipase D [Rhizopus microsporus]
MYKEVAMALPLYSHLAKRTLLALSPNIYVQRHPSRALDVFHKDSIFFWAHHEKICVVDNEIAFIGGIDKCFGRYDTPGHILVDDFSPDSNGDRAQIWPGKDYSNPRIIDFHTLDKPFEDNMDRSTLPRMPWHDVSMRIVGQAAKHVARHFVQRWNYLRRKKPSAPKRPTPMLLPVPDTNTPLDPGDDRLCHPHTCDSCKVQILRSVSSWSIGSVDHVEHSILDAYIESIRESKYFIYIENQFFVTSTKSGNTMIENGIGEAIVNRIIEASNRNEKWKAIIIIPLVPGFPANIDENEARTVRLIMQCQYLSISRGPNSIFAKLHAAGITNTHEYINFYGLRNWAELNGQYVTEQVYIHAKAMIVDDRRVIIGSANINERSQLGTRDSEIAACIEDTEYVDSMLNGGPFKAGKFAHSLRMRLMCEHVGLDVDQMDRDKYAHGDLLASQYLKQPVWDEGAVHDTKDTTDCTPPYVQVCVPPADGITEKEKIQTEEENKALIKEDIVSSSNSTLSVHDLQVTEQEKTKVVNECKNNSISMDRDPLTTTSSSSKESSPSRPRSVFGKRKSSKEDHLSFWATLDCDTDNNGDARAAAERQETPSFPKYYCSPSVMPLFFEKGAERLTVGQVYDILKDPLADAFQEFWHILARSNTDLFRRSFLVAPDNNIKNWNQYRHYIKMAKLFLGRTDTKHGGTKTTAAAAAVTTLPIIKHGGETIYDLLKHIKGHLVIWPSYFMEEEENEFLFPMDKIAPLEIFD